MTDYENFLIRKILHADDFGREREIDLSFLIESSVVETIDLSGPRIILKFNDQFSLIRDELGVKAGDLLRIDVPVGSQWGDDTLFIDFRILTMPVTAKGEVVINCLLDDIFYWKQPIKAGAGGMRRWVEPRIFRGMDPVAIVKELDR